MTSDTRRTSILLAVTLALAALGASARVSATRGGTVPAAPAGSAPQAAPAAAAPLRLAIAGVVHGHVHGFMHALAAHPGVQLTGVFEPDAALREAFRAQYKLPTSQMFASLDDLLATTTPEAVAAFTNTFDHRAVIEAAAARRVHVMVEKPLAVSVEHAHAIEQAASRGGVQVIVNYETTWYPSHRTIWQLMHEQRAGGAIRKMVAMDGHNGPKEIGVQPEFLDWLGDPVRDGGGALFDFGCYGANLMTWLMDDQRPVSVTAVTQHFKPHIYPKVDDEASILIEYPAAQGIVQASWNWPFGRKDFEVYGERAYAIATGGASVRVRLPGQEETTPAPEPWPPDQRDSLAYLTAVAHGRLVPSGPSSLRNNIIVVEILDAARESARTGRAVRLSK